MRNRIDGYFDQIELICLRFPMRIAEGCMALMLAALATYIADERVMLAGMLDAPPYTPLWVFTGALLATAAAHLLGLFMPLVHRGLARLGVTYTWLIEPHFDDLLWRRICCVLAIIEYGMYAGVMSRLRWTAWLFCLPYSLLMSAAYIRLGAMRDARAAGSANADIDSDSERDQRRDSCADAPVDPLLEKPLEKAATGKPGQFRCEDRTDQGRSSGALELSEVG